MALRATTGLLSLLVGAFPAVGLISCATAAAPVDFSRDVLPILSSRCFECHGPDAGAREADLRLDVRGGALAEGSEAPAIVPGMPDESAIIARLTAEDEDVRMPPAEMGERLSADEIGLIRDWIAQGAEYSEHWAFVSPHRPEPPDVEREDWSRSPVDQFVLAGLQSAGLTPAPRASRETLIRRATLDLIGLPPTPDEVADFLADKSPDAFAKLVDRLLASPHYGERWGRHWLDVARYADSGGFETDIFFGHAWRYRDYVIRSFNADKPYDQFVREQIAGDELYPGDAEARVATGFYAIGPVLQEAGMVDGKLEYDLLTDAVDATGSAFLGLTVACARCHDHKYDPISQADYYALQAVFSASDQHDFDEAGRLRRSGVALRKTMEEFALEQLRGRVARAADGPRRDELLREIGEYYIEQDDALREQLEESEAWGDYGRAIRRYRRAIEEAGSTEAAEQDSGNLDELLQEIGEAAAELPGQDGPSRRERRRMSRAEREAYYVEFGRQRLDLVPPEGLIGDVDAFRLDVGRRRLDAPCEIPVRALAHRDEPIEVRILGRGELSSPGERAMPGLPQRLAGVASFADRPPQEWRSALAEWMASPDNPLTARVLVNRVWQGHFGVGLVQTPNDFGIRGERPTHPELLDWLAVEFVENGWSLKHLHRTIMLTSVYQMSAATDSEAIAADPENRLLARYQPHRMEAEALWDNVRAASGALNLDMYGLPVAPPLDEQEEIGNYKDWPTSSPEELDRRGVYLLTRRSFRFPMLSSFDLPDNATSCGRRDVTTIPNQCLALLNNRTMHEQAARFAERLLRETEGRVGEVAPLAWRYAYGREITAEERDRVGEFLTARQIELADGEDATGAAVGELCLAIFNTNEFLFIP